MVKGTSRRVIVVDSPDPKLFEQAIFIVRNDALTKDGITSQQLLGEACRIAKGYTGVAEKVSLWQKIPWWVWLVTIAVATIAVGVWALFVLL